jgi:Na+/proline symporter
VRVLGSCLFLLQNLLYMGVALWAPVIAISSVTSMPEWVAILAAGGICTLYTAVVTLTYITHSPLRQYLHMDFIPSLIIIYS